MLAFIESYLRVVGLLLAPPQGNLGQSVFGTPFHSLPSWTLQTLFVFVALLAVLVSRIILRRRCKEGQCWKCHYSLEGLISSVCPECGIDLTQRPKRFQLARTNRQIRVLSACALVVLLVGGLRIGLGLPQNLTNSALIGVVDVAHLNENAPDGPFEEELLRRMQGTFRLFDDAESAVILRRILTARIESGELMDVRADWPVGERVVGRVKTIASPFEHAIGYSTIKIVDGESGAELDRIGSDDLLSPANPVRRALGGSIRWYQFASEEADTSDTNYLVLTDGSRVPFTLPVERVAASVADPSRQRTSLESITSDAMSLHLRKQFVYDAGAPYYYMFSVTSDDEAIVGLAIVVEIMQSEHVLGEVFTFVSDDPQRDYDTMKTTYEWQGLESSLDYYTFRVRVDHQRNWMASGPEGWYGTHVIPRDRIDSQ